MKQAVHIFKKDLRRLWPLLVAILAFIAVHTWILCGDHSANFVSEFGLADIQFYMLTGILYFMLMIMIVLLIHEDPPAGKQFWMTRPIYKKSLWASKCGFILLFGAVIPLAANFMILFNYGLEPRHVLSCFMDCLSVHLSLLFTFFAIAVLMPKLRYILMALLIFPVLIILCGYNWVFLESFASLTHLYPWLIIGLSFAVIILQYLTRRRTLAATIYIIGMLLIFGIAQMQIIPGTFSDKDIARSDPAMVSAQDPEIDNLMLAFQKPRNKDATPSYLDLYTDYPGMHNIIIGLDISNIPPSSAVGLYQIAGIFTYEDGAEIPVSLIDTGFAPNAPEPEKNHEIIFSVNETDFGKYGNRVGSFSGEATFKLVHFMTDGRLSLKPGSFFKKGATFLSVNPNPQDPDPAHIILRVRSLISDRENLWAPIVTFEGNSDSENNFIDELSGSRSLIVFGGPDLKYSEMKLKRYYEKPEHSTVELEKFLRREIFISHKTETGPFKRKFEAKNIRLADYTKEEWLGRINESVRQKSAESQKGAGNQ